MKWGTNRSPDPPDVCPWDGLTHGHNRTNSPNTLSTADIGEGHARLHAKWDIIWKSFSFIRSLRRKNSNGGSALKVFAVCCSHLKASPQY